MRKAIGAALAVVTVLATAAPSVAAGEWFWTRTYADPAGDAPAAADIRTTVVDTGGLGWRVISTVPGLGDSGIYRAYFDAPNASRVALVIKESGKAPRAVVKESRRRPDGTLGASVITTCPIRGTWDAAAGRVMMTLPRPSCSADYGPAAVSMQAVRDAFDVARTDDPVRSTTTYPDERGEVGPTADVLGLRVTRTTGAIWTSTRVADLVDSGAQTFDLLDSGDGFTVRVVKRAGQPAAASLWRGTTQVPCAMKVSWDPGSNHLSVQAPLRCDEGLADTWDLGLMFRRGQVIDHVAMFD